MMRKKYIISFLIPALLTQLFGCYSMKELSNDEMTGLKEGGDLIIHTKNSTIYFFEKSNYRISSDTIYAKGYAKYIDASDFKIVNDGAVPLTEIELVQQDELNLVTTSLLSGGVLLVILGALILIIGNHSNDVTFVIPAPTGD